LEAGEGEVALLAIEYEVGGVTAERQRNLLSGLGRVINRRAKDGPVPGSLRSCVYLRGDPAVPRPSTENACTQPRDPAAWMSATQSQ
jgi:hypothetical protein